MHDRIIEIFADTLRIPPQQINDDTSPDNTPQWDSLQAVNLILAIEDRFGIRLTTREIVSMRTVGMVRQVLRSKGVKDV